MQNAPGKEEHWIIALLNVMITHFLSIVFVVILFLLLWIVPQINDLIIVINQPENDWIVVMIFFSALSVLAFLISVAENYMNPSSRESENNELSEQGESERTTSGKSTLFQSLKDAKELYLQEREEQGLTVVDSAFHETQRAYTRRLFPKILGTILILIATYAVNNTYQKVNEAEIIFGGNWGLLVGIVFLVLLLNKRWADAIIQWLGKFSWTRYLPVVLALLCFAGILVLGLFNEGGSQGDTKRLFYSLLMLTALFLLLSTSYNKLVLKVKYPFGVGLILLLTALTVLTYIILFFNPEALKSITPLSIVMICIIGIYGIFNLIKMLGHRLNVPLLSIVLILGVFLSVLLSNTATFTHFDATSVPTTTISPDQRLELESYVKAWIKDRKKDIQKHSTDNKFPIILVSAEGGGSRAGLWSFLVQSYLYDRNPDYFKKYLFSMSGASGGGVGNNMFFTQAYGLQKQTTDVAFRFKEPLNDFNYRASLIYHKDYLSSSVASVMGRDLFKSITNIGVFKDRGALLENEWEAAFNSIFEYDQEESPLAKPYLQIMPDTLSEYITPLLITNTTHLQSGERAIISPVSVAKDSHNLGVFMDLLGSYPKKDSMIKRSTAMSLNARFPFISPVARINKLGQFGDSGYYNNIGGSVTRRLQKALTKELNLEAGKDSTIRMKYKIINLLITNYEKPLDYDSLNYSSQLTAPASMIWNATFAHPTEMKNTLKDTVNIRSRRTVIQENRALLSLEKDSLKEGEMIPFIPLGRYLSRPAVLSLEKRLDAVQHQLNALIPEKKDE